MQRKCVSKTGTTRRPNMKRQAKFASLDRYEPSETMNTVGTCIVPQRLKTVLRWQNVQNALSMGLVQSAYITIALNGPYDPLYTLGGGSCTGFRELAALYNRYIVDRCRITMRMRNGSSSSVGNDLVGFIMEVPAVQVGMVGSVVTEDVLEARRCSTMVLPYNNTFGYRALMRDVIIRDLEALPTLVADYEALSGTGSSNPSRSPVALAGFTRPGGPQASTTVECIYCVEFSVTFYQPTQFTTA